MTNELLISIVDDEECVRESLSSLMRSEGYKVKEYASAQDYLTQDGWDQTACLILDVRLPGMSGLELQRHLEEVQRERSVVFISGHASGNEQAWAMRSGAVAFLRKPFSDEALLKAVRESIARSAATGTGVAGSYQGIIEAPSHAGYFDPMKRKQLGNSDMSITPVGYGSWAIGGAGWQFGWGKQNDDESVAAIHRALALGVNWIDTAAVYGLGHSEEIVARALEDWPGPRPYVFTKCGLRWNEQGQTRRVLTAASIRKECEESLRRLDVDAIDLYQIHWPVENTDELEEGWSMMAQLKEEGKVRWIGVSNFNVEQMKRAQAIAPITSLQPPYSLVHPEVETEILPFCKEEGIGVIVYSPMASGLLTGAMTRERIAGLPDDDWRKHDEEFNEPRLSENLALMERLRRVGRRQGHAPGSVAVAWTLQNPAVTAAIVGARKPEQVNDMVAVAGVRLTQSDLTEIETVPEFAGKGQ